MNRDEQTAFEFLKCYLNKKPTFEPDGNIPPDFSIDDLGVEVRRLNQNYFDNDSGKVEGLETVFKNIHNILKDVLSSFDDRYTGKSYFTAISYERPLEIEYKDFKDSLRTGLEDFLRSDQSTPHLFEINDTARIRIIKGSPNPNKVFRHGITSDLDSGGWVIPMISENITHCISEKSKKIKDYKDKYSEWWLLLIDYLNIFWTEEDLDDLVAEEIKTGEFDRIIVVEPTTKEIVLQF